MKKKIFLILFTFITMLISTVSYSADLETNTILEQGESFGINSFIENSKEYTGEFFEDIDINQILNSAIKGEIDNTTIQLELGKELEYQVVVGTFDSNTYDKDSNLLTIETGKIEDKKIYIVKVSANKFEEDQHLYNVQVKGTIFAGENEK